MILRKEARLFFSALFLLLSISVWASSPVSDVQQKLYQLGYNPGNLNGELDEKTEDAIKNFQRDAGIFPVDGRLDEVTLRQLLGYVPVNPAFQADDVYRLGAGLSAKNIPEQPTLPEETLYQVDEVTNQSGALFGTLRLGANAIVGVASGDQDLAEILESSEASIDAGGAYLISLGVNISKIDAPFSLELAATYKADYDTRNGDKREFQRVPITLVGYFGNGKFRVGTGLSIHLSPTYESPNAGDLDARDGTGYVFRFDYRPRRYRGVFGGVAYENIDYDFDVAGQHRVNGNNVQAHLGWGLW